MADSSVTLCGSLTRDPELKYLTGGQGVASFGLAVNRRYQRNGQWEEETSYFNVNAWYSLGENVAASLTKGMRVIVTGTLRQRSYETQSGEKRSVVEIQADEIGPSLRWAQTPTVVKNPRNDNGGNYAGGQQHNGGQQSAGASRRPATASVPHEDLNHDAFGGPGDDEPF